MALDAALPCGQMTAIIQYSIALFVHCSGHGKVVGAERVGGVEENPALAADVPLVIAGPAHTVRPLDRAAVRTVRTGTKVEQYLESVPHCASAWRLSRM